MCSTMQHISNQFVVEVMGEGWCFWNSHIEWFSWVQHSSLVVDSCPFCGQVMISLFFAALNGGPDEQNKSYDVFM